jgi:hypothetical protein
MSLAPPAVRERHGKQADLIVELDPILAFSAFISD